MIRGWFSGRRRPAYAAAQPRPSSHQPVAHRRLRLEALEPRCLLTAANLNLPELVVDSDQEATSLLVQFRENVQYAGSLRAHSAGNLSNSRWEIAPGLREVKLAPGQELEQALDAFENDPNVLYVEPDYRVRLNAFIPNDPGFASDQWALHNTGQIYGLPGFDIRAPDAWDVTLGSPSVVVAVIDTGIDYTHPDLAPNMWTNPDEIPDNDLDDDGNGYIDDIYGYDFVNNDSDPMDDYFHGTHVAGSIAAVADNEIGIAGVAPHTRLMALKFLDETGSGVTSNAISALNYAVKNGASISNNSWGGGPFSQAFLTAIQKASAANHIFVASAGNYANNNDAEPFYPASYNVPNVISVAATDAGDHIAYFSNYGRTSVDVGAPGVDIYSTLPTHMTEGMAAQGLFENYGSLNGTSMAAPHVAGVLALLRATDPSLTPAQAIAQIKAKVDRVPSLTTTTVSGGRVNAAAALGVVPSDTKPPTVVSSDPSGVTSGIVDHVQLVFSEAINPSTFDLSDVLVFEGPHGSITPLSVDLVPGSDRKFNITFDSQSLPGQYFLTISSHISDLVGLELDQDDDGTGGVDGLDEYLTSFTLTESTGTLYSSPNVPIAIRGFDQFTSYLTINEFLPIADVNVHVNLSFPRVGNLHVFLVAPSGLVINLSYRNGDNEADFQDTIFDDEAEFSLLEGLPPYAGSFRPDDALAALDGENALGTWQLVIQNVSTLRNRGTLNSWALDIMPGESSGGGGVENDPPIATDDIFHTEQDVPLVIETELLLSNDSDPNDDPLIVSSVGFPIGGSVQFNADGTVTFTPDAGSLAPASFQYIVSDGVDTAIGNVNIVIRQSVNLHNGFDVNNDTFVSPIDALLITNYLNAYGSSPIIGLSVTGTKVYYDVVPDNVIAPNDVLAVVNHLNAKPHLQNSSLSSSAEDESPLAQQLKQRQLQAAAVDLLLTATDSLASSGQSKSRAGRRAS